MDIDITKQIEDLQKAKAIWINSVPEQEQNNLFALNISVTNISLFFDTIIRLLNLINKNDINPVELCSLKSRLGDAISSFQQSIPSHQGLGSLTAIQHNNKVSQQEKIKKICNSLQNLKNDLIFLVPVNPEIEILSLSLSHDINAKIAETKEWFQELNAIKLNVEELKDNATQLFQAIDSEKEKSESMAKNIQELLATIEGYERETNNAKINADSSASSAKTNAESVSKLVKMLEDSVEEKDNLFKEFEEKREKINGLLENANQVGLARSFQIKREQQRWLVISWISIFLAGIGFLSILTYKEILPLVQTKNVDFFTIASRFLLAAPLIWLTWFAARQYGHSSRVYEDYAFKESTAMAFAGYRNEMCQDPDMLKLLQESAIQNFAANPTRLIMKNTEPASPAHAVIDKISDIIITLVKKKTVEK